MLTVTSCSSSVALTWTCGLVSGATYLTALPMRLARTWRSRVGCAETVGSVVRVTVMSRGAAISTALVLLVSGLGSVSWSISV
jgi:hypothetical protein